MGFGSFLRSQQLTTDPTSVESSWRDLIVSKNLIVDRRPGDARAILLALPNAPTPEHKWCETFLLLRANTLLLDLGTARDCVQVLEATIPSSNLAEAHVRHRKGVVKRLEGIHQEAISLHLSARATFEALALHLDAAFCDVEIAAIHMAKGDSTGAVQLLLQARSVIERHGSGVQRASAAANLGAALHRSGNVALAEESYASALALDAFQQPSIEYATLLHNLAIIAKLNGDHTIAVERYLKALDSAREAKADVLAIRLMNGVSDLQIRMGDLPSARSYADMIRNSSTQVSPIVLTEVLGVRAHLLWLEGNRHEAITTAMNALDHARTHGLVDESLELANSILSWSDDDGLRLHALDRYREVQEVRTRSMPAAISSMLELRSQYERERAEREMSRQKEIMAVILETQSRTMSDIGRDLHDSLGQDLTVMQRLVDRLSHHPSAAPHGDHQMMETLAVVAARATAGVRRISHALSDLSISSVGFEEALQRLVMDIRIADPSLHVECSLHGDMTSVSDIVSRALYRIIQSSVMNVLRHARATRCHVQVVVDPGEIRLVIEDDGIGFRPDLRSPGIGLREAHARAALIDGTIVVDSAPGHGTSITVTARSNEPSI